MSAPATRSIIWAHGEDQFCLSKVGLILDLEEKCKAGIAAIFARIVNSQWSLNDIRGGVGLAYTLDWLTVPLHNIPLPTIAPATLNAPDPRNRRDGDYDRNQSPLKTNDNGVDWRWHAGRGRNVRCAQPC